MLVGILFIYVLNSSQNWFNKISQTKINPNGIAKTAMGFFVVEQPQERPPFITFFVITIRVRIGNNFTQVCVSVCLSVCVCVCLSVCLFRL